MLRPSPGVLMIRQSVDHRYRYIGGDAAGKYVSHFIIEANPAFEAAQDGVDVRRAVATELGRALKSGLIDATELCSKCTSATQAAVHALSRRRKAQEGASRPYIQKSLISLPASYVSLEWVYACSRD